MKAADHSRELEQVMAYLDGALDARAADGVRLHMAACAECRQAERDLRGVSQRLHSWNVGEAPTSLQAPAAAPTPARVFPFAWLLRPRGLLAAAASVVLVSMAALSVLQQRSVTKVSLAGVESAEKEDSPAAVAASESASPERLSYSLRDAPASAPQTGLAVVQGPMIVRTARLTIVADDFDAARAELERIVQRTGGFVGQIVVQGASGSSRRLEATLRIPTLKLDESMTSLRRLGRVIAEAQDGEDVGQQSADLDTRLANARVSETRLREILQRRTGKLSDVLDVERELARVRGEIEQMESERRSLDRRVTYATVAVSLSEDRKSEVNLGPVPVSRRLRNAFVEGWTNAISSAVGATLFAMRVAPTLLLWALLLAIPAWMLRRRLFKAGYRAG